MMPIKPVQFGIQCYAIQGNVPPHLNQLRDQLIYSSKSPVASLKPEKKGHSKTHWPVNPKNLSHIKLFKGTKHEIPMGGSRLLTQVIQFKENSQDTFLPRKQALAQAQWFVGPVMSEAEGAAYDLEEKTRRENTALWRKKYQEQGLLST